MRTHRIVAEAKEALESPSGAMRFDDLVHSEAQRFLDAFDYPTWSMRTPDFGNLRTQTAIFDGALPELVSINLLLGRWGRPEHMPTYRALDGGLRGLDREEDHPFWRYVRGYPRQLVYCALGIGAVAGCNWGVFETLFSRPMVIGQAESVSLHITAQMAAWDSDATYKVMHGAERRPAVLSGYVESVAGALLFSEEEWAHVVERFELINAMHYVDFAPEEAALDRVPQLSFVGNIRDSAVVPALEQEIQKKGFNSQLLHAGWCRGEVDNALRALAWYKENYTRISALRRG